MIFLNEVLSRIAYNYSMKNILFTALFTLTVFPCFQEVLAQNTSENSVSTAPIFISPYQQRTNTYSSAIPTIVMPENNRRTMPTAQGTSQNKNAKNSYQFVDIANPYANSAYGRMRSEKAYYDKETQTYVNQYEYMRLLSNRGNTAELNRVRTDLQQNGVFNPAKYQMAMNGGGSNTMSTQAGALPSQSGGNVTPSSRVTSDGRQRVFIQKDQDTSDTPQKIHQGYDDEAGATSPTPKKNQPIFLR